ncbi:MAG TPA: hypothetical protein VFQ89_00335 [Candidatus Binatia bacterium]|nr:hypothetical protein [Candidatus Binatia bacterium]
MQKPNLPFNKHQRHCSQPARRPKLWIPALVIGLGLFTRVASGQEEHILPPGTYRLEMILASITKVPIFGTSKSASKSISLVEIKRDGAGLIQTHKTCDFRVVDDSKFIKMIFPDKFVAALARHSYPLQIDNDGHGWRYRADLGVERIGYKSNGDDAAVPSKVDDPAVYDWDGDGQPGATLKLSVPLLPDGELYVVQRGHSILSGKVVHQGRVEGSIEVRDFDQKVIGAKPNFLARSPEIVPDVKESRFVLESIAAGSSCDTLKAAVAKP